MAETTDPTAQVAVEQDGRVLTGNGEPSEALQAHIDRRTTEPTAPGAATDAPASPTPDPGTVAAPSEPQTRGRQRFSDLTRERDTARSETAAERTKREGLEREVAELRAQVARAQTPQQQQQAEGQLQRAENRQADAARPQGFQFPTFEAALEQYPHLTYDEWSDAKLVAFADWREAQRPPVESIVRQALDADRSQRTVVDTAHATHAKGRAVYKDFDTQLTQGPGAFVPLGPTVEEAQQRAIYVLNLPHSEHVQYQILRDGDLARRLQRMSGIEFGVAIAGLAPAPTAPAREQAAPPAPYTPVGTGSSTTTPSHADLTARGGHDFDKSGWRERRDRDLGRKRA